VALPILNLVLHVDSAVLGERVLFVGDSYVAAPGDPIAYRADLAEALLDCATVKPEARHLYEEGMRRQDSVEELQEYRALVEDRNRTSMSDIVGRAWVMGRELRRQA
jgi:hypothetical protein